MIVLKLHSLVLLIMDIKERNRKKSRQKRLLKLDKTKPDRQQKPAAISKDVFTEFHLRLNKVVNGERAFYLTSSHALEPRDEKERTRREERVKKCSKRRFKMKKEVT
jgi:hypothetical protein